MQPQMKHFLRKFLLFTSPILLLWITEAFILPPNFFTYRLWESLRYSSQIPRVGPFYPNITLDMTEQGDLGHHTANAMDKKVVWKTDEWGFRNDRFIADPDVLIIGDSFVAGTGLSQDQTLTARLTALTGGKLKIYNMAPSSLDDMIYLMKNGIMHKPKLLIFSMVERSVPKPVTGHLSRPFDVNTASYNVKRKLYGLTGFDAFYDRLTRFYDIRWAQARINKQQGSGLISPVDHHMLFLQGKKAVAKADARLKSVTRALISYKQYCDAQKIDFLFLPMPNKETVYYDLVPFPSQPDLLFRLDSALSQQGITTLNLLPLYNNERRKGALLYHPDDSHWNGYATQLVAAEIKNYLDKCRLFVR
ncbi:MAG: alginate o-acetyltransferase AlgJ [Bacteroidetes bacterium]|nr:alginate o-acetyltransferase AlgJ [Bacteroidota bacterium]